jgi:hypothetical protein
VVTMLAEIFMVRAETVARASQETTPVSISPFIPFDRSLAIRPAHSVRSWMPPRISRSCRDERECKMVPIRTCRPRSPPTNTARTQPGMANAFKPARSTRHRAMARMARWFMAYRPQYREGCDARKPAPIAPKTFEASRGELEFLVRRGR